VEFKEFAKIGRLNREVIVTEKIDGTNASVHITPATNGPEDFEDYTTQVEIDGLRYMMRAGSRSKFITPTSDNFGFAAFVKQNAQELAKLGPGVHYGEWWGSGIQRRYGLAEKRWSLFNVHKWGAERPACCHVVPVITRGIGFSVVDEAIAVLRAEGSWAAPGFMKPEGVVAFHAQSNTLFKVTLERDEEHKSQSAA
jgi:hypothetical protein